MQDGGALIAAQRREEVRPKSSSGLPCLSFYYTIECKSKSLGNHLFAQNQQLYVFQGLIPLMSHVFALSWKKPRKWSVYLSRFFLEIIVGRETREVIEETLMNRNYETLEPFREIKWC